MDGLFGSVRLLHKEDCQYLDQYPVSVYRSRERKPTCRVCQNYLAKYLNCCHIYLHNLIRIVFLLSELSIMHLCSFPENLSLSLLVFVITYISIYKAN